MLTKGTPGWSFASKPFVRCSLSVFKSFWLTSSPLLDPYRLLRAFAEQGAQLVLLHKDPTDPQVQHLLHLVQLGLENENERIYAEAVDCSGSPASLASIHAFCQKWIKNRKKSPIGDDLGVEKIDTMILSDDESTTKDGFGTAEGKEKYYNTCLRAKLALVEGLKPVIGESNTRVVNIVSPFYAASAPLPMPGAGFLSHLSWHSYQPWTFSAVPTLGSIAVFKHLTQPPNDITCLSISPGVTRSWLFQTMTARGGYLGYTMAVLLSPLIWACGKSMAEAVTEIERGVHLDLKQLKQKDKAAVGALINAGKVISLRRTEISDPNYGKMLYQHEIDEIRKAQKKA